MIVADSVKQTRTSTAYATMLTSALANSTFVASATAPATSMNVAAVTYQKVIVTATEVCSTNVVSAMALALPRS